MGEIEWIRWAVMGRRGWQVVEHEGHTHDDSAKERNRSERIDCKRLGTNVRGKRLFFVCRLVEGVFVSTFSSIGVDGTVYEFPQVGLIPQIVP